MLPELVELLGAAAAVPAGVGVPLVVVGDAVAGCVGTGGWSVKAKVPAGKSVINSNILVLTSPTPIMRFLINGVWDFAVTMNFMKGLVFRWRWCRGLPRKQVGYAFGCTIERVLHGISTYHSTDEVMKNVVNFKWPATLVPVNGS